MGLFGYIGKSEVKEIVSKAIKDLKARRDETILEKLSTESLDRARADVMAWREALDEWEGAHGGTPDRYKMMQLYAEIIQDDSVTTHLNKIVSAIAGTEFQIGVKKNGKIERNEDLEDLFKGEWYESIIRHIIEAEMQGFTIVEVKSPTGENTYSPEDVEIIPRYLVIPELGKVRTRPTVNIDLIDYTAEVYKKSLLFIGDKKAKGLFNNIALLYIYKKNSMAYWSNYQSKFGIPPVIVKTDLANKTKVDSIVSFLENMRSNTFTIVGYDDTIETLNSIDSDAFQTFDKLAERCDNQIAKVLEGQTMTSSDGSSRSQAEVHERTSEELHQARLRRVERVINSQLLSIMRMDFNIPEGVAFGFVEKKNVDEIIDRVVKLGQAGYKVEKKYLEEVTGMPLEEVETQPVDPNKDEELKKNEEEKKKLESVMKEVEALYDGVL